MSLPQALSHLLSQWMVVELLWNGKSAENLECESDFSVPRFECVVLALGG